MQYQLDKIMTESSLETSCPLPFEWLLEYCYICQDGMGQLASLDVQ